jgi:hypothetical protein
MPEKTFHFRVYVWHIVFTLFLPLSLSAQEPVVHTQNEAEALNDILRDLEGVRIDLNRAKIKDLLSLPYLSPDLAQDPIALTKCASISVFRSLHPMAYRGFYLPNAIHKNPTSQVTSRDTSPFPSTK